MRRGRTMNSLKTIAITAVACGLTACANTAQPLYAWGGYESQVYEYFKGQPMEKQIVELEKHSEQAKATGTLLPPGYQAHLGLLYAKLGRDDKLAEQLSIEKTNFPESSGFFDGLMKKFGK